MGLYKQIWKSCIFTHTKNTALLFQLLQSNPNQVHQWNSNLILFNFEDSSHPFPYAHKLEFPKYSCGSQPYDSIHSTLKCGFSHPSHPTIWIYIYIKWATMARWFVVFTIFQYDQWKKTDLNVYIAWPYRYIYIYSQSVNQSTPPLAADYVWRWRWWSQKAPNLPVFTITHTQIGLRANVRQLRITVSAIPHAHLLKANIL